MREPVGLRTSRFLVAGGRAHTLHLMRQVFDVIGVQRVQVTAQLSIAIDLLRTQVFSAVFCDDLIADGDVKAFANAARRTADLVDPLIPIILVCSGPRKRDVEWARDVGFNGVLALPLSAATVQRKLRSELLNPRPFIAAGAFFGPDRRSKSSRSWGENDRRVRQPKKVRISAPTI